MAMLVLSGRLTAGAGGSFIKELNLRGIIGVYGISLNSVGSSQSLDFCEADPDGNDYSGNIIFHAKGDTTQYVNSHYVRIDPKKKYALVHSNSSGGEVTIDFSVFYER